MGRQIYRQESLERLSSPEQLDMLMPVTSPRGWIALLGVGLLLALGMAWAIFGTMDTTVEANGMLTRIGGVEWAYAARKGFISKIDVQERDTVARDDVLLRVVYTDSDGNSVEEAIRSPRPGRVLDVSLVTGSPVEEGTPLVSVETPDSPLSAVAYFAANDGYKVNPDMTVKILPVTELDQGSTYLPGRVTSAARFPASRAEMMYWLKNDDWANSFLSLGPVLEVVIDVKGRKRPTDLFSGTPCKVNVIVQSRRPISFLVPGLDEQ